MKQHPAAVILLREIERFLKTSGMNATAFGRAAMNDGNFVPRLRRGRTPRLETFDRVRRYMEKNLG